MGSKIIVDGYWGCGKSALISSIERETYCRVINEPNHLASTEKILDIHEWYIKQHLKNQDLFYNTPKDVVMERSVISSFSFLYAIGDFRESVSKSMREFTEKFVTHKAELVFLFAENSKLAELAMDIQDTHIRPLLCDHDFMEKYSYFYRTVLPLKFGIRPMFIDIFDEKNKRKSTEEISRYVMNGLGIDKLAEKYTVF